eukprot:GFYU01024674.1.p1 GENE.GFYU01024674.1~~GFYU01024674.1.p1  ORF type:complete len:130 (-),score=13.57 GFYU01024674.1:642-983(-)
MARVLDEHLWTQVEELRSRQLQGPRQLADGTSTTPASDGGGASDSDARAAAVRDAAAKSVDKIVKKYSSYVGVHPFFKGFYVYAHRQLYNPSMLTWHLGGDTLVSTPRTRGST